MIINNISIIYYIVVAILGGAVGHLIGWANLRLVEYKKVFLKDIINDYLRITKPNWLIIIITAISYIALLYFKGISIETVKYFLIVPMLYSAFMIDLKLLIIPNRLNLTIFELGIFFALLELIFNGQAGYASFISSIIGMGAGAGIFILITIIGGIIAGKEAMGLGDVKLMGALGLIVGWLNIIMISVMAFLIAAIVGIGIILSKKRKAEDYIPFGPFLVLGTLIAIFVPTGILLVNLLRIFSLGMINI